MKILFKKFKVSNLLSMDPIKMDLNKTQLRILFAGIIISHALWSGVWFYYRLKDIFIIYTESLYTGLNLSYGLLQFIQFTMSFGVGLVLAIFLFSIATFFNKLLFITRIKSQKLNASKITCYQLSFTPVLNTIILIVSLITQTMYYDRGFIFYPFLMATFYIGWMAFNLYRIIPEIDKGKNQTENKLSKMCTVYFALGTIGFFVLFLLVPLAIGSPYETLYTLIW